MAPELLSLSSNWKKLQAKLKTENTRQSSAHDKKKTATDDSAELRNSKSQKRKRNTKEVASAVHALKRRKSAYTKKGTNMGIWGSKIEDESKQEYGEPMTTSAMAPYMEDKNVSVSDLGGVYALGFKSTSTLRCI